MATCGAGGGVWLQFASEDGAARARDQRQRGEEGLGTSGYPHRWSRRATSLCGFTIETR